MTYDAEPFPSQELTGNKASHHDKGARTLSADQQAEVKRRSSRAARDNSRRRRRARTTDTPQTTVNPQVTEAEAVQRAEISRAEAKRQAREASSKSQTFRGRIVNGERTEGIRRFIRETTAEIRKVIWPDRETTRNLTIVVIALSAVLGLLLGGLDFVLYEIFEAF